MKNVDIIIPIYNAYDDLVLCIDSLKRTVDLSKHRVVLINDCSSDERIKPFLDSLQGEHGFEVVHNESNKGFSGNINIGFHISEDHDVILLNSDTITTPNWVEKMIVCAYSEPSIGTVTPLSNNATLCSVPNFCEVNKLPDSFTLEEFASLVERVSLKRYPRITVAHGFCMYVKREVIRVAGDFDAKTFEKGYGEENDFCNRVEQLGYHHVMCDDTYIYHSGTKSFVSKEKQKLIDDHDKILNERYPYQMQKNREHVRDNPNAFVQDNLRQYISLHNGRKTILFQLHSDFREGANDNLGGVQLHVKDMTHSLKKQYNIIVVARDRNYLNCTIYTEQYEKLYRFYVGESEHYPSFNNAKFFSIYKNILTAFCVDLVHIHHVIGMTYEMFRAAKECNIPIIFTIHDHYTICRSEKLLDYQANICVDCEDNEKCKRCLNIAFDIANTTDYLTNWRQKNRDYLNMAEIIISPSDFTKNLFAKYYPEFNQKTKVISHGLDVKRYVLPENDKSGREFRIAFIGGINQSKGSEIITKLVKKSGPNLKWYLFGGIGDRELEYLERDNFFKFGPYTREQLPKLLEDNKVDLVCILSIWHETFCYTLTETVAMGIPVLVSNVGALAERVKQMQCGWIVEDYKNVNAILTQIDNIQNDTTGYHKCRKHIQELQLKTVQDMANEYVDIYNEVINSDVKKESGNRDLFDANMIYQASDERMHGLTITESDGGNANEEIMQRLFNAENSLYQIYNSTSYKLLNKLRGIKFPGKQYIKKFMYRVYKRR